MRISDWSSDVCSSDLISTRTPAGWIAAQFRHRAGLHYISCDGSDLVSAYVGAKEAADFARRTRKPVFLHMGTVRLYGHAGSDVQDAYLPRALIESDEARDPLLAGAALMAEQGWMTPAEIAAAYENGREAGMERECEYV